MASGKRSNGEGTVFYDKAKDRWVASMVVGWRNDRPLRRKRLATSRTKATRLLREMADEVARGQVPMAKTMTVEQWMTYYLENIARKALKPTTYQGYCSKNTQYIVPLLGHHRLTRLSPEHIEQAWDELAGVGNPTIDDPRPLSSTTILQTHRILSRALKMAVRREHVMRNACSLLDAPTAVEVDIEPLTPAETSRVLEAARKERNAARWSVALGLGLRQGEALGLTWNDDPDNPGDVDLEAGTLTVRHALQRITGKGLVLSRPKSKASRRTLALPSPLVDELRRHRAKQNEDRLAAGTTWHDGPSFVFAQTDGCPIDPKQDWDAWGALLKRAEVRYRRLHDARHTAATILLLQGVDMRVAKDILGHSQISMTMRYQHVVDEMKREAADRMGVALWGAEG